MKEKSDMEVSHHEYRQKQTNDQNKLEKSTGVNSYGMFYYSDVTSPLGVWGEGG